MWVCGLDWAGPGQGQVADACEWGNEPSGSVKCGEFLDQLQTSQLLKKDSAPWSIIFKDESPGAVQGNIHIPYLYFCETDKFVGNISSVFNIKQVAGVVSILL